MQKITIDINSAVTYFVRGWVSGIGRTTIDLVKALDKEVCDTEMEITLYSQNMKGIGGKNLGLHFKNRHLYFPFRPNYNQLLARTPIRKLLTGCDLYHIPHNFDYVHHPDRTIITLHDALYFTHPEDSLNHQFARSHYPTLAQQCRGIITCSESSKRDIMQYMDIPEDKIDVCYWGYNKALFHPIDTEATSQTYFLLVSCSMGRKNTMSLLRAYAAFAKHNPSHHLKLVWPHPSDEAQSFIEKEGLTEQVHILSHVSDDELCRLYNGATATFYPSRYEGFGLPVLESLACGTPVVTCSNSSLPEVGGDAAFYVNPDDTDGMAKYMEQFENLELQKGLLRDKCLAQADKFSWQRCAQQTIQVYQKHA